MRACEAVAKALRSKTAPVGRCEREGIDRDREKQQAKLNIGIIETVRTIGGKIEAFHQLRLLLAVSAHKRERLALVRCIAEAEMEQSLVRCIRQS